MKQSVYNYILYDDEYSYWFNTLTLSYFRLSKHLGEIMQGMLSDLRSLELMDGLFYNKLVESGFIIDEQSDELAVIRERNDSSIHGKDYFLVILPTLDCNFACWYCIQSHKHTQMQPLTIESVKNHIDYMIVGRGIHSMHIEWFGGEPFMKFSEVIVPISAYAKTRCAEAGIPFTNSATTNGYYLTPDVSSKLEELGFYHFQITLDGDQKYHDSVKCSDAVESCFAHVLKNINCMLKVSEHVDVSLRLNYTHDNLTKEIVGQVNTYIDGENRGRIIVTPKKVWQKKVDRTYQEFLSSILDEFVASGYRVQRWMPYMRSIPCYASKEYYCAINYNGDVVKCTACSDLYRKDARGSLHKDGKIIWKDDFDKKYQSRSYENERCLGCKRLPVCMGLCPRDYLNGDKNCKYSKIDYDFDRMLIDYVKHCYETV